MRNLTLQLKNGTKITIEGFYMTPTYSGLISGEPNEELNDEILMDIPVQTEHLIPV